MAKKVTAPAVESQAAKEKREIAEEAARKAAPAATEKTPKVKKPSGPTSTLTKSQNKVMMAICIALDIEPTDKALITTAKKPVLADLSDKDGKILLDAPGIDVAKVCRQLHREELVVYGWNEDRSRFVGITEEGFKQLQLPVKEKAAPAPKADKPAKTTAADKVKNPPAPVADDDSAEPVIKPNPLMKNFIVMFKGDKKIFRAKDQAEFDVMKKWSSAIWAKKFA